MLNRAGFAQIGQHRPFIVARLHLAGQLAQSQDGNIQLAGQGLDGAGNEADLLLAVLTAGVAPHQLQVVNNQQIKAVFGVETAGLGPQLQSRDSRRVVNKNFSI